MFGFKVINQYEQGIVFRFGKMLPDLRQPGLTWLNPFTDRLRKVNMQIITAAVPGQEGITRDNVTVSVDAVVYYRVIDPVKALINVQDYTFAVSQVAQTSLRSVIGHSDLDLLLSERDKINAKLKEVIDAPTEEPWGIRVERVEVKHISLPESMKRSMSRQAEAERERRARIITADGEYQASKKLAQAATIMSADPAALQLRLLQTVVEVAAEKNSTLVMPVPVELLRFFDRAARPGAEFGPNGLCCLPRLPACSMGRSASMISAAGEAAMTTVAMSYWPADTSEPVLETTVGGVLRAAAAAGPQMLAMVGGVPDPGQRSRWTYAELLAEAEQAARALTARFAPGERVAVWAPNLPEWVILEFAAGLAGLVLVTVNPALRPAELAYVLNQSGAAGIFLVPEFRSPMAEFLAEVRPDVPALREVVFFTDWAEFLGTAPAEAVLPEVRADDIAQIQYTSGTTGVPKGAELHHRGLTNNARFWAERTCSAARRGVREPDAAVPHGRLRDGGPGSGAEPGRARAGAGLRPGPGSRALRGRTGRGVRGRADDDDRHARPS